MVEVDKETEEKNYLLWRIENGVAEGSTEIPKGSFFFFYKFHPQLTVLLALMFSNSVFWMYQVSFFFFTAKYQLTFQSELITLFR